MEWCCEVEVEVDVARLGCTYLASMKLRFDGSVHRTWGVDCVANQLLGWLHNLTQS